MISLEIGIDCVDISEFKKDVYSNDNIIKKVFTDNEISYCEKKLNACQHFAVRFAAKEAVVKAFSCYNVKVLLNQIEILNEKNGIPFVKILNNNVGKYDIKISLSHSKNTAIAMVIIFESDELFKNG